MPQLYRVAAHARSAIGDGKVLLTFRNVGGPEAHVVLDPPALALLDACNEVRTLAGHAAAFVSRVPGAPEPAIVERILSEFASAGMLANLDGDCAEPRRAISTVVVPTRDRPALAARAVQAIVDHLAPFGRSARVLVVDGSAQDVAQSLRARLDSISPPESVRIEHVTRLDAAAYIAKLSQACGVPEERLTWALLGRESSPEVTTGAQRNLALLMTAGEHAFFVDDDVVLAPLRRVGTARVPRDAKLHLSNNPQRIVLCETVEELRAAVEPVAEDLLAAHEELLGASIPAFLRGAGLEASAELAALDAIAKQAPGQLENGRVRVTCSGIAGDSGMRALVPWSLGLPTFESRDKLAALLRSDASALSKHRLLLRHSTATQLYRGPSFMSTAFGIDNTRRGVPFFPQFRNQDGVFGYLNVITDRTFVQAMVDSSLLHEPDERRRNAEPFPRVVRPCDAVMATLQFLAIEARASTWVEGGRTALGANLENDWLEIARAGLVQLAANQHRSAAEARSKLQPELVPVLDTHLRGLESLMQEGRPVVRENENSPAIEIAGLLKRFFTLLADWPALWGCARDLRGQTAKPIETPDYS